MFKNKGSNSKYSHIITRETIGMTFILFSLITFVIIATREIIFSDIGIAICAFMYGTFGYGCMLLTFLSAYIGTSLVFGRNYRFALMTMLFMGLSIFSLFLLLHAATTMSFSVSNYGEYIKSCYLSTQKGYESYTFGGVVCALIVFWFARGITFTGAMITFSLTTIVFAYLTFFYFRRYGFVVRCSGKKNYNRFIMEEKESGESSQENPQQDKTKTLTVPPSPEGELFGVANSDNIDKMKARNAKALEILYGKPKTEKNSSDEGFTKNISQSSLNTNASKGENFNRSYSERYTNDLLSKQQSYAPTNYVFNEKAVDNLGDFTNNFENYVVKDKQDYSNDYDSDNESDNISSRDDFEEQFDEQVEQEYQEEPDIDVSLQIDEQTEFHDSNVRSAQLGNISPRTSFKDSFKQAEKNEEKKSSDNDIDELFKLWRSTDSALSAMRAEASRQNSNANLFEDDMEEHDNNDDIDCSDINYRNNKEDFRTIEKVDRITTKYQNEQNVLNSKNAQNTHEVHSGGIKKEKSQQYPRKYVRPSLDLLIDYPEHNNVNTGEIEENKSLIVNALSDCKIECSIKDVVIGPSVTRYDVVIEDRTKVSEAEKRKTVIAMALQKEGTSIYLNYAKGALSIEVPNAKRTVVGLKGMLASSQFINSKPNSIAFALGKNLEGEIICPDITAMPHMLIAGASGSGKSICLNSLLLSLLYKYTPDELRLILVDPKQIEFISYDGIPHLMINEIITEVNKTIKALEWAVQEMNRRYSLMSDMSTSGRAVTNINEYNENLVDGEGKLPKIVIVLDEFGDLMMQSKQEVERRIIKLAQKARACGIHLVLATQRPSVDCVTPLIKANMPTRISFKVASQADARTIFDATGAEKLLGKGDMYFSTPDYHRLVRLQGCLVTPGEIQTVCTFVIQNNVAYFDQSVSDFINKVDEEESSPQNNNTNVDEQKINEDYVKVLKHCIKENKASVAFIQREFPIGYIKTCKIIDWMENMGYIAPAESSNKPRKMLITMEEFIDKYGDVADD